MTVVTWPRAEVLDLCKQYGSLLPPIPGIDPAQLLAALAMNESSLGLNCGPRHEDEWDVGGRYSYNPQQAENLRQFPYLAACSMGPWQLMFYNAPGYTPTELNNDLSLVTRATIGYMSRQIQHWNVTTVEEMGQIWNHGSPIRPPAVVPVGVQIYCKDLQGNYVAAEGWLQ